jgi:hypothetical protein
MPDFDRAELLDLLGRLGAEDDATVLAAARELHGKVRESGLTWDRLLHLDADTTAASQPAAGAPVERSGGKDEVARLIERLLARPSISDALHEELVDFKRAIADGTFEEEDAQYVRALAKRLGV